MDRIEVRDITVTPIVHDPETMKGYGGLIIRLRYDVELRQSLEKKHGAKMAILLLSDSIAQEISVALLRKLREQAGIV
jgi:hypothetical protein